MKISKFLRLLLFEALSVAMLWGQSYLNLSFETASGGVPTGWYLYGADYQIAIDTSTAVDGAQSLRISSLTTDTSQFGYAIESLTAGPAIGKTFHLAGYIKTQAVNGSAELWANAFDAQGNDLAF